MPLYQQLVSFTLILKLGLSLSFSFPRERISTGTPAPLPVKSRHRAVVWRYTSLAIPVGPDSSRQDEPGRRQWLAPSGCSFPPQELTPSRALPTPSRPLPSQPSQRSDNCLTSASVYLCKRQVWDWRIFLINLLGDGKYNFYRLFVLTCGRFLFIFLPINLWSYPPDLREAWKNKVQFSYS